MHPKKRPFAGSDDCTQPLDALEVMVAARSIGESYRHGPPRKSFCERCAELMDGAGWDYAAFEARTFLNRNIYYRIKEGRITPRLESVVAICVGLAADWDTSKELLMLGGSQFDMSMAHYAYKTILMFHAFKGMDYCNSLLDELGLEPLGSRQQE